MTKFEIATTLEMSVEDAWAALSDPATYRRMYLEGLDFESADVEVLDDGPRFRMQTRATPRVQLPGPIQKIIGDKSSYTEHVEWDRAGGTWAYTIELAATDRVSIQGTMTIRAEGDTRCVRQVQGTVDAKIFGVGGLMEKTVRDQVLDNYDKSGRFLNGLR